MAPTLQQILKPELVPVIMSRIKPFRIELPPFEFPPHPSVVVPLKTRTRRFLLLDRRDGKYYAQFID